MYEGPIRTGFLPCKGVEGYENYGEDVPIVVRWDKESKPYYFCELNREEYVANAAGDKLILKNRKGIHLYKELEGEPTHLQAKVRRELTISELIENYPVEYWWDMMNAEEWKFWESQQERELAKQKRKVLAYKRTLKYRIYLFLFKLFKIKRTIKQ